MSRNVNVNFGGKKRLTDFNESRIYLYKLRAKYWRENKGRKLQ